MRSTWGSDPNQAAGFGTCQEGDDNSQIGCLVDADSCSLGYATRKSAATFADTPGPGTISQLKALAINGTPPFTQPYTLDQDLAIWHLVWPSGTLPVYQMSRRLYVSTLYGFEGLQGGEAELVKCYGNTTTTDTYMTNEGFVVDPNGVRCIDYPETGAIASPAPNVQGFGNVALSGCAFATEHNACITHPISGTNVQVCGNGIVEGFETCDPPTPPNGGTRDGECSRFCTLIP